MDPVQQLLAIEEIKRLKARYIRLCDNKQWDLWADVFTEDCQFQHPNLGAISGRISIVTQVSQSMQGMTMHHDAVLPDIEVIDERTARGTWSVANQGERCDGSGRQLIHTRGEYHERYRKEPDGRWRICRIGVVPLRRDSQVAWTIGPD